MTGDVQLVSQSCARFVVRWGGHRYDRLTCHLVGQRFHGDFPPFETVPESPGLRPYLARVSIDVALEVDEEDGTVTGQWVHNGDVFDWDAELTALSRADR